MERERERERERVWKGGWENEVGAEKGSWIKYIRGGTPPKREKSHSINKLLLSPIWVCQFFIFYFRRERERALGGLSV